MPDTPHTPHTSYAGFWIRLLAHIIDCGVLSIAAVLVGLAFLGADFWIRTLAHAAPGDFFAYHDPFVLQLLLLGAYFGLAAAYYTLAIYLRGATLGKSLLGLRVADAKTRGKVTLRQAGLRCFGYLLSWFLSLGYLLAAFHPRKRALHDLVAGTVVVTKALILGTLFGALFGVLALGVSPRASYAGDSVQLEAGGLIGSDLGSGFETAASYLFSTRGFGALSAGPRLSLNRSDVAAGGQATLWFVNAIGVGASLEDVIASSNATGRLLFAPSVSARLLRFGTHGAWAGKFGGQYDSLYKWSLNIGVTLELGGVSNISESVASE